MPAKTTGKKKGRRSRAKTPKHLAARIKTLQQRISEWDCTALLITNARDIRYLTGFIGDDSWAIVSANSSIVHIISDSRFEEQIQREAPHTKTHMRKGAIVDELEKLAKRFHIDKLGLQSSYVTLAQRKAIAKKLGARNLKHVDDGLIKQRAIKIDDEVELILEALAIQQAAFNQTLAEIEPGQAEEEICALLEYKMRTLGADGPSFPTIVAADANGSLPHAIPGKKKVKKGGTILIDWGAVYQGYCSDLTRVVAIGSMPRRIREIYSIVLEAQEAAIEAIGPGKKLSDIDKVAREIIKKAGYGDEFGHGLGHGIGLDIHEQPVLSWRAEGELEPGHIVTVEPGIYLPGVGGVRIEDDVLVTDKGHRVLSDLPKSIESAII